MPLSPRALAELKAIYRAEFGQDLTDAEASAVGNRLLRAFDVLTCPPASTPPVAAGSNLVPFDRFRKRGLG